MNRKDNSVPRKGMNRDSHPSELSKEEYSFSLNSTLSDEHGNGQVLLQNESSNYKCSNFKEGYFVIGHKYDMNNDRVYFFLHNPTTTCSEIGWIPSNISLGEKSITEVVCGCDIKVAIESPLEDTDQVGYCEYTTLISDCCEDFPNANKCLNFRLTHPIHESNVEIKDERIGKFMYFTDGLNPQRRVDLDRPEIYYQIDSPCGDPIEGCLQCEKLRVFRVHDKPCVVSKSIQAGGNLKAGLYEVAIAYCSQDGIEITNYYSTTNPIPIFDMNNRILAQPNLDYTTNFSILVELLDLDTNYLYFKLVVQRREGLQGQATQHVIGVYPTTTNQVTISSLDNALSPITTFEINSRRPTIKSAKGLTAGKGYLFHFGITEQRELNLQPVVNLMGAFGKWVTYQALEGLYEDGSNVSNFTGYMRDEVQPYAIRFYDNKGFETATFPLIARPPKPSELEEYVTEGGDLVNGGIGNTNVESIIEETPDCAKQGRRFKWQFENTADEGDFCIGEGESGVEVEVEKTFNCFVSQSETGNLVVVETVSGGVVNIPEGTDLVNFILNNRDNLNQFGGDWQNIEDALSQEYEDFVCEIEEEDNCERPEIERVEIFPISTQTEVATIVYENPSNLPRLFPPANCSTVYAFDDERDSSFESTYMEVGEVVYLRNNPLNGSCNTASQPLDCSVDIPQTFFLRNAGQVGGFNNLLTTFDATPSTGFEDKLHTNAIWFSIDFQGNDKVLFEISPLLCTKSDDNNGTSLRLSVYDGCGGSHLDSYTKVITDLTSTNDSNKYIELSASDFSGQAIVAIDAPLFQRTIGPNQVYTLRPPCGCFNSCVRPLAKSNSVTFTNLTFGKRIFWKTVCTYTVPDLASKCEPVPHKKGDFAYWESVERYPCNRELYDSSWLRIGKADLPNEIQDDFEEYFATGVVGNQYTLDVSKTNFQDKNIRHYKFPCSKKVPYMNTEPLLGFNQSIIYPIGFNLTEDIINAFLDIALNNGLITPEERASLVKYEILRGDNRGNKSVVAKGIVFDMYKFNEATLVNQPSEVSHYSSYPLNTLGTDIFNDRPHPFASLNNNLFTFHSPDTHFYRPTIPSEVKFEGYLFGKSSTFFDEVPGHPKYTILSSRGMTLATTLATTEVTLELTLQGAELVSKGFGSDFGGGLAAGIVITTATIAQAILQAGFRWQRYRTQWIETLRNIGKRHQFAYYSATIGNYNYFLPNPVDNSSYRSIVSSSYLRDGRWKIDNKTGQPPININNEQRENSVFLNLGKLDYNINYPVQYRDYDNYDSNSSTATRADSMHPAIGKSLPYERNTAVPYVTLKNYLPSQYGTIYSIKWISTNNCGDLTKNNPCGAIFGGTTYLSRFAVKRKFPFFLTTAFGQPDDTAFEYSRYFNIPVLRNSDGFPIQSLLNSRYYVDHKINSESQSVIGSLLFPRNDETRYRLDFEAGSSGFYITPPSKFYLFSYGFPYFIVESEFNCNFRYAGTQLEDEFYPHMNDVLYYTRQDLVPNTAGESFRINQVYFEPKSLTVSREMLPDYSRETEDKKAFIPNRVMYSNLDSSELDTFDPWLIYRALDSYDFDTSLGTLIDIKVIESGQILARFRNGHTIFGAIDLLADRLQSTLASEGTGGIFSGRNINFSKTPLGHGGTLNTPMVSCKFGHFWADAKRGEVFNMQSSGGDLNSAGSLKSITQGVSKWFKEQLPFKILSVQGVTELDVDNPYNGVGITMGWDERQNRVLLTKKDYRPKTNKIRFEGEEFVIYEGEVKNCNADNLVQNPIFQTDLSGWSVSPQSDSFVWSPSGAQYNGVDEGGSLSQNVFNEPGCFEVTIKLENITVEGVAAPNVVVNIGGEEFVYDFEGYMEFTETVEVSNPSIAISYSDDSGSGNVLFIREVCVIPCSGRRVISLGDSEYFEDCSWTIGYSPLTESWISYYSYKPNYYVSFNDYFQTGVNNGDSTLWSHLPFMSSYQVFYGQRYPFTVEYPITTKATLGNLTSIEYWMDVRKYYNKYDYADITGVGFTDVVIYKNDQNTGNIKLITEKNNDLSQKLKYPKFNNNSTEVLQSEISGKWSFNFLYNRIKNEASHLPIWRNDCSNVEKTIDNRLINYKNMYQDRLRGDYFLVRLSQSEESRYKYIFRFANDNRNYYE